MQIAISVKDIFRNRSDNSYIIPTNTFFRTKMDNEYVSPSSVQGRFQLKYFKGKIHDLDKLISESLNSQEIKGVPASDCFGSITKSVLNNVTDTNVYKLVVVAVVIGLVFYNLIGMLIDFLKDINEKKARKDDGRKITTRTLVNILLVIIILVSLLGYGITKISLPQKVYIGTAEEQVDDFQSHSEVAGNS